MEIKNSNDENTYSNQITIIRILFVFAIIVAIGGFFHLIGKLNSIIIGILTIVGVLTGVLMFLYRLNLNRTTKERHEEVVDGQKQMKNEIIEAINEEKVKEVKEYYSEKLEKLEQEKIILEEERATAEKKIAELLSREEDFLKSNSKLLKESFNLFINKDSSKAIKLLDDNILKYKEDYNLDELSDFYRLKGDLLITQTKFRQAYLTFEEITKINPSAFHLINFGLVLYNGNQLEKANDYLDRGIGAMEINPDNNKNIIKENIYHVSAIIKLQLEDLNEAKDRLDKAITLYGKSNPLSQSDIFSVSMLKGNLGLYYYHNGLLLFALSCILESVKSVEQIFDSENMEHLKFLGEGYINLSNIQRELGDFNKALDYVNLGEQYFFIQGKDYAFENFNDGLNNVLYTKGLTYSKLNELEKAVDYLDRYLQIVRRFNKYNPRKYDLLEAKALNSLGSIYIKKGEKDKSRILLKESLKIYEKLSVIENTRFAQEILGLKKTLNSKKY